MLAAIASFLAHQGGWDEILLVVGPLLVVGAFLIAANRRASRALENSAPPPAVKPAPAPDPGDAVDSPESPAPGNGAGDGGESAT
jgi:hypothetical protein